MNKYTKFIVRVLAHFAAVIFFIGCKHLYLAGVNYNVPDFLFGIFFSLSGGIIAIFSYILMKD